MPFYVLGMQAKHAEIKRTAFEYSRSRPLLNSQRKIFMNSKKLFSTTLPIFRILIVKFQKKEKFPCSQLVLILPAKKLAKI